ncbi:MAG: hypothetical protein QOJ96_319 [Alphaproteobacteria bacterium]|nr:hypothetical protein [Alphaproteobacteria bacterium]
MKRLALFLLFFGGYAALVAWFKYVDVYHAHFSDSGALVLVNNLFRVLFVFYLFWILQSAGAILLRWAGLHRERTGTLDYLALTCFAGTGPWHVVLLAIGYLNLLNMPMMVILTAPAVAFSFSELRLVTQRLRMALLQQFEKSRNLFRTALIALSLVWLTLLLVKGLYPGGSQEYYVQYFPSQRTYLEHGGLWPTEAWWDYFYSKGAGLLFLGMLLTDPLAPQLVVFCLFSVAGLVVFLFIRRLAPGTTWPITGVLLFFAMYIYTPSWGEFVKLHEFNTSFVIAVLWMATVALSKSGDLRQPWICGAALALTAAIIINTAIGVFLGGVFTALALAYAAMGDRQRGLICFALAALAGAVAVGIMLINFATIGLFSDLALVHLWKFADIEKLYQWGALPMLLIVSNFYTAVGVPLAKSFNFLQFVLRLNLLWPLFLGGLVVAVASGYARYRAGGLPESKKSAPASSVALILIVTVLVFAALTVTEGRGISTSYYRFSTFMVPVMIVAGIFLWTIPLRNKTAPWLVAMVRNPVTPLILVALCGFAVAHTTRIDRAIVPLAGNALKYAIGIFSIDDAFGLQSSGHPIMAARNGAGAALQRTTPAAEPRRSPEGIYPGARGAYAIVGPRTPIWSMHLNSYCMLPDCKMMTSPNFIMSRSWDRIMWGTPEEGRELLRSAGLNYFFFSIELFIYSSLPLSPLFSPDNIARYFGIRWTDGISTLLTWSGPGTAALDAAWVAEYRQSVETSPYVRGFPNARMKAIFERLNTTPHPWYSVELPLQ